jgi:hypothetical protein
VTDDLYAAASVQQEAWAVGAHGSVLHWDETVWTATARPTTASLYVVAELTSADVWAVGAGGTILLFSPTDWISVTS